MLPHMLRRERMILKDLFNVQEAIGTPVHKPNKIPTDAEEESRLR